MSLQVWLPLTGSLENKGLYDATFELKNINNQSSYATIDNSGKIGKCYCFDNSNSQYIIGRDIVIPQNSFTAACWFYPITYTSDGHNYIFSINEQTADSFLFSICLRNGKPSVRIANTTYQLGDSVELNKWYHLATSYDGSVLKIYLNGSLAKTETFTVSTPSTATKVVVAMRSGGACFFNGKVNDCRIYDNVLSVKEIKELSKAMVTHCKLDNPVGVVGDNIILNSAPLPIPGSWTGRTTSDFDFTVKDGYECIHFTGALNTPKQGTPLYTTNNGESFTPQANQIIAFSADVLFENVVEGTNNYYLTLYSSGETINNKWYTTTLIARHPAYRTDRALDPSSLNGKGWTRIWFVGQYADVEWNFVKPCIFARDFTGDAYFKNIKFEIGSSPTDWTPAPTDPLYSGLGYNELLACGSGSPRHRTYASFDGTNSLTGLRKIFESDAMNEAFTISFWFRHRTSDSSVDRLIYHGIVKVRLLTNDPSLYISWRLANADLSYDTNNNWATGYYPVINEWTMVTFTISNNVVKLYINGAYSNISDRSGRGAFIRGQYNYNPTIGENLIGDLSDLRCYMTALSADDIKELYQTTCSIDRNGNLHAYDVCEDDNGIKVLGNGVVESSEFNEAENLFDIYEFASNYTIPSGSNLGRIALHLSPNTTYVVSSTIPSTANGGVNSSYAWAGDITDISPNIENSGVSIGLSRTITTGTNGLLSVGLYRDGMSANYISYTKVLDGTYYVSVIPASNIDHTSFRKSGSVAATSLIEY